MVVLLRCRPLAGVLLLACWGFAARLLPSIARGAATLAARNRAFGGDVGALGLDLRLDLLARKPPRPRDRLGRLAHVQPQAGQRVAAVLLGGQQKHLLKMPVPYFSANPPGELMSRLTNDVTAIRYLTGGGLMMGLNTTFAYVTTVPMMLWLIMSLLHSRSFI